MPTIDGWREIAKNAVDDSYRGYPTALEQLVAVLIEQDNAKQHLRDKGYGCTGMGLLETVEEVPHAITLADDTLVLLMPKSRSKVTLRVMDVEKYSND